MNIIELADQIRSQATGATWLHELTPRIAGIFEVGWSIIDYSVTPPEIIKNGLEAPHGASS